MRYVISANRVEYRFISVEAPDDADVDDVRDFVIDKAPPFEQWPDRSVDNEWDLMPNEELAYQKQYPYPIPDVCEVHLTYEPPEGKEE